MAMPDPGGRGDHDGWRIAGGPDFAEQRVVEYLKVLRATGGACTSFAAADGKPGGSWSRARRA